MMKHNGDESVPEIMRDALNHALRKYLCTNLLNAFSTSDSTQLQRCLKGVERAIGVYETAKGELDKLSVRMKL